jgi:hypothetical protein
MEYKEQLQRKRYSRAEMMKRGQAKVGDGKDVAHKKSLDNGGTNDPGNLEVQSRAVNRGWRKNNPTNNPDGGKK